MTNVARKMHKQKSKGGKRKRGRPSSQNHLTAGWWMEKQNHKVNAEIVR